MAIRRISIIGKTYRHAQRYRQIIAILFRYGFGDLLEALKIEQYIEVGLKLIARKRRRAIEDLTRAERLRRAFEELGPTFVKLGQLLSTRPDLLPAEYIEELSRLQDDVQPFEFTEVERLVRENLGRPLEEIYDRFDRTPLASASLGQVHRAKLRSGEEVVVKVQRPGTRRLISVDLEILLHIATLGERHLEGWEIQRPTRIVEEFARAVARELDYTTEAAHMERFAWQFTADPTIEVPTIYREATSERVLTMDYVDGIKPTDREALEQAGLDSKLIAVRGASLVMKQVFVHGFFHADPHPGNIFILPDNVICLLDFGLMGRLDRTSREDFVDLIRAVAERDERSTASALLRLTDWEDEPDRGALEREVAEFVDRHFTRTLRELDLGRLLREGLRALSRQGLRLPSDLFLMAKAITTVENVARRLDPDFDLVATAKPFLRRVLLARADPRRVAGDVAAYGADLLRLFRDVPGELRELLYQAKRGKLKIGQELRGLQPMLNTLDQVSNRLSFAVVLASLVIGSGLIVLSGIPPKWNEIPVIGLAGFVVAGLMGFWLLISILRHGRM